MAFTWWSSGEDSSFNETELHPAGSRSNVVHHYEEISDEIQPPHSDDTRGNVTPGRPYHKLDAESREPVATAVVVPYTTLSGAVGHHLNVLDIPSDVTETNTASDADTQSHSYLEIMHP